jgi:predicted Na+-dependent transporter
MAKGNVPVSVGLMVVLAAFSAVLAPLLLSCLLPLVARGANLKVDTVKIVITLLITQLIPLGVARLCSLESIGQCLHIDVGSA